MLRVVGQISFFVLFFLFSGAMFGVDPDQDAKRLAGTQAREWVFKRFDTFMGSGNCTKGEIYVFKANHTVVISRCSKGTVHDEIQQWSIEGNQLETRLTVGAQTYLLIFEDNSRGHFMRLRIKPKTKTARTIDKIFQLVEE